MKSKLWLLAGIAIASALALFGATQVWVTLDLAEGAAAFASLEVTGQQLNQSLSPIAIAALAAALALTIAGRGFRRVLGVLVSLLGVGIIAIAVSVLTNPVAAASGGLAEATGLTGHDQLSLVTSYHATQMIVLTLVAGSLLVLFGVLVLILGGRWKSAGRKYEADAGRTAAKDDGEPDRISDWEAMSDGDDPTDVR